jgi:putative membrane-bound dehydrogenase-like protein
MRHLKQIGFTLLLVGFVPHAGVAQNAPTVKEESAALQLADPNLMIEIVASEPAVKSPVAIAWDEFGRLYVVEMTDYPADGSGGQIKRLEDRDNDGHYEHVTIFADKLSYPSGVLPWKGGILVTSAPNLLFFKDIDGDGRSDERNVILTGFGEGNQQLRVNSPTLGLDNWVYLANGRSGGAVRRPADSAEKAVAIPRNDLRVRPTTGEFEPIAGFSQFGLPRDDWGNRFPSWNTVPIRHVVLENGSLPGIDPALQVAEILNLDDGGRLYSLAPQQQRFNAETVAFFNATCGPLINRGSLLGAQYHGHAFVCEPLTSVVHHRRLSPNGPTFRADRVEEGREFLASSHPWFRPVNLANGPDGALYVVDFCRAWVEHPAFVPEKLRNSVDFRQGHEHGRIWRIRPKSSSTKLSNKFPGSADIATLVNNLSSESPWLRDTSQRLLIDRQDSNSVKPLIETVEKSTNSLAIVHALWTLEGLNALPEKCVATALHSRNEHVRFQAIRLIQDNPDRFLRLLDLNTVDSSIPVRLQTIIALSKLKDDSGLALLGKIAAKDADSIWLSSAILGAIEGRADRFLSGLLKSQPDWLDSPSQVQANFLTRVATQIAQNSKPSDLEALISLTSSSKNDVVSLSLSLGRLEARSPQKLAEQEIHRARSVLLDRQRQGWVRALAFRVLAQGSKPDVQRQLRDSLKFDQPGDLQSMAARSLPQLATEPILKEVFDGWEDLSITTRRLLLGGLTSTPKLAGWLLDALKEGKVTPSEIDPASRNLLRKLGDASFQKRVSAAFKDDPARDRSEVIRRYETALKLTPDPTRGKLLFERNCQTCHTHSGKGTKVGPELLGVASKSSAELLISILDPAREATPDGIGVIVLTKDGRTLSGLLVEDTPSAIRLKRAEGIEDKIVRSEIEAIRSTGRSLMPDGLEQLLGPQEIADVIGFLRNPTTAR